MNPANAFPVRRLGQAAPFLILLLAGCGDYSAYPEDLKYPVRTDPIVQKASQKEIWYPDQPGALDEFIVKTSKEDPAVVLYNPLDIPVVDPSPKEGDRRKGKDRTTLAIALQDVFGTPRNPAVSLPEGEDTNVARQQIEDLKLTPTMLGQGSVIYRRYCLQCHGVSGNGRGPTGPWVHPHPRDYRQGQFKFISTRIVGRPSRDDLLRVLHSGVDGTSMPSFALLGDDDLEKLVSYVMHLSLRGEVEMILCKKMLKESEFDPESETVLDEARLRTVGLVNTWYDANKKDSQYAPKKYTPPATEEERLKSVERGYKYFVGTEGGCVKCHKDFGRQVPFKFDDWGTPVRPANLTNAVYRGGRRPIDTYWRVRAGINPSGMPPAGSGLIAGDDDSKAWDVVNFVQALPYPAMLPKEVHDKIYVEPKENEATVAEH